MYYTLFNKITDIVEELQQDVYKRQSVPTGLLTPAARKRLLSSLEKPETAAHRVRCSTADTKIQDILYRQPFQMSRDFAK